MPPDNAGPDDDTQYVLITQCLQNDLFLNLDCQLCLPESASAKLLLNVEDGEGFQTVQHRRVLSDASRERSPLAQFLAAVVGGRIEGKERRPLHLINIRDWHVPGEHYDRERSQYGAHCEAGTWGAQYLEGFEQYLDPGRTADGGGGGRRPDWADRLHVHHVYSDTLFDFQYAHGETPQIRQDAPLTTVLDDILARTPNTRVAVIGVLTDIKILLLLVGLRSRYNLRQLIVSDSLTATRTLDRHLTALDFAQRVLWVEVADNLVELARFLGVRPGRDQLTARGSSVEFSKYSSYVADKQGILSYEDARLRDYRIQTSQRLRKTGQAVTLAARFLMWWGIAFMSVAIVLSVLAVVYPGRIAWQMPAFVGGAGLVQLVTVFFVRPVRMLQDSLGADTIFRMILESRSLKVALARYHVTTAESLGDDDKSGNQLSLLERELQVLDGIDEGDFRRIRELGVVSPTKANRAAGARPT